MSLETSLMKIEKELFTITNELSPNKLVTTAQVLNDLFAELKNKFLNPQLPGLPSGFLKLDELTQG